MVGTRHSWNPLLLDIQEFILTDRLRINVLQIVYRRWTPFLLPLSAIKACNASTLWRFVLIITQSNLFYAATPD